jgi:hypothetical protein
MRIALLALASWPVTSPSASPPARATSAYTTVDLDRCVLLDREPEPASNRWRCKGYAGIPLFVQNGDDRYDLDAGREDNDQLWSQRFDYPGKTVEWRVHRGKPFAIIYRLDSANPEAAKWSRLMVETIGRGSPGCRVAAIDALTPRANEQARKAADRILSGEVTCLLS